MALFKCKMCGGTIEFEQGATVGVCEYCGTKQTLPKTNDEVLSNLFNRANNLRLKCEFDKAASVYEKILEKDDSEAEAHWGLVLCKYGIEYVEDPKTYTRIPTCHRTLFESITSDADFQAAVDYSDSAQQSIYEAEARAIDRIQKDILEIVKQEKPFDVFICYKETDETGKRTADSVIANDIYYQLTQEGFKVFYAAITLEDKLGREYEPYIFAALNSAKIMLAIGTKPEYFSAVWVKNEWSRFMNFMKTDRSKLLIPCYRDMDAYDLPEEFSHLQAQDMSKIGFINDVIRGIKKVLENSDRNSISEKETAAAASNASVAPLLKRVYMFLEEGDFKQANEYCERVLDVDPECAEAYVGKFMVDYKIKNKEDLGKLGENAHNNKYYIKALKFGGDKVKSELLEYFYKGVYENALKKMESAEQEENNKPKFDAQDNSLLYSNQACAKYKEAADLFKKAMGYKDSDNLYKQCIEKAEISRKNHLYDSAVELMRKPKSEFFYKQSDYKSAIYMFEQIKGWKNSEALIEECKAKIKQLDDEEEEKLKISEEKYKASKKRTKKIMLIVLAAIAVCVGVVILITTLNQPENASNKQTQATEEIQNTSNKQTQSNEKIQNSENATKGTAECSVGDYITFGTYEQDNDFSNGSEEIEWLVLAKEGNKALVISKYALDAQPYNEEWEGVTWEDCTLRKWLNDDFYNEAFTSSEQSKIQSTNIANYGNPEYGTPGGNDTTDKVFLLSLDEVKNYFASNNQYMRAVTKYAEANGAYIDSYGNCWWWLRSPGYTQNTAAFVVKVGIYYSGSSIDYHGYSVDYASGCVRPALWINL